MTWSSCSRRASKSSWVPHVSRHTFPATRRLVVPPIDLNTVGQEPETLDHWVTVENVDPEVTVELLFDTGTQYVDALVHNGKHGVRSMVHKMLFSTNNSDLPWGQDRLLAETILVLAGVPPVIAYKHHETIIQKRKEDRELMIARQLRDAFLRKLRAKKS
jgi:hypothetical protein